MSEPKPVPHSGISGIISQIFSFIDKPWKALVVFALLFIGGGGYIFYLHNDEIIEAWLAPREIELKTSEVPEALEKLVKETGADVVLIWGVDIPENAQWYVGSKRRDGEKVVISGPRRLPVIANASDIKSLISVMEGSPSCLDLVAGGSPMSRRLYDYGRRRGCAIPIPPNPTSLVGVIYLAWDTAVDDTTERVAVGSAREIAKTLSTR